MYIPVGIYISEAVYLFYPRLDLNPTLEYKYCSFDTNGAPYFFTVTSRHLQYYNVTMDSHGSNGTTEAGLRQRRERSRERRATELDETKEARLHRMLERVSCF